MNIRMSTKGKRPLRSLTPSDKIHAIQRIHDGESKASVARDIGVPESTLRGWCKNEDKLRFMSRQTDKMTADSLAEKLGASAAMLGGPPEKRQKMDSSSLPFNFSTKIKYDEVVYKRSPLNGLDYSSAKSMSELGFNGLPSDYIAFSGAVKNKVFGADISRQGDPAVAAISPLTSLSHLSGLSSLAQSPLAISFNELTSNLNLLAQLNPGLAAMSGLNGLAATASTLRNVKTKPQPQQSPRSENGERQQGLSVKNWAKQKSPTHTSSENSNYGLNLCSNDNINKNKMKCPSPSIAPSLGNCVPSITTLPDDPLLYWLKSQQAMLGLGNIYPQPTVPAVGASSPPMRSSTPQQSAKLHINVPLNASAPVTSSSTPSVSLDDKSTAWYKWCKALGASLNSLAPAAPAVIHGGSIQQQPQSLSNANISTNIETSSTTNNSTQKTHLENILFNQLTKNIDSSPIESATSVTNHSNDIKLTDSLTDPEDLSAKTIITTSAPTSPIHLRPVLNTSPRPNTETGLVPTPAHSPYEQSIANNPSSPFYDEGEEDGVTNMADCKEVLDNLLYKINNNPSVALLSKATTPTSEGPDRDGCYSESNDTYISDNNQNSSEDNANNNHSNKTDEEERFKVLEVKVSEYEDSEAIKHGEKFLKWLENCSNPRITATHLIQLRFLISALKSNCDSKVENSVEDVRKGISECCNEYPGEALKDNSRMNKIRRRK